MQAELELAADGFARGEPGDSNVMRARHRTAHGIMQACLEACKCDIKSLSDAERNWVKGLHVLYAFEAKPLQSYALHLKRLKQPKVSE